MKKNIFLLSLILSLSLCLYSENNNVNIVTEVTSSQAVPWVKQVGLQYSMPILARVYKNAVLFQPTGSMLGVFKDNLCWGYGGLGNSPVGPLYNITTGYNTTPVAGFSYKVYDATTGKIYDVVEPVTFTSNVPVGAINAPISLNLKFSITVTSSDINKGTVSGDVGPFTSGQSVHVTATPLEGYHFVNWTDGVGGSIMSTNADYTFNASENRSLIANFEVGSVTEVTNVNKVIVDIFPNPVSNFFEITLNSPTLNNTSVQIYNLQGLFVKQIFSGSFAGDKVLVVERDNSFSTGLYLLKVSNGTEKIVQKVIFQ